MKINKVQLKRLKASRELHGKDASAFMMLVKNWKYYLFLGALFSVLSYLFFIDGSIGYILFLGGAFLGAVLRDIVWFRLTEQYWPISDAVTDWEKVDEIIAENEP